MAILTYTTNLTAWYRGESYDASLKIWRDMVGIKDLTATTGTPSLVTNDGKRPFVRLGGATYLDSIALMSSFIGVSAGTVFAVFRLVGPPTGNSATSAGLDENIWCTKTAIDVGLAYRDAGSGTYGLIAWNVAGVGAVTEQAILLNTWVVASWRHDTSVRLAQNDPSSETSTVSGATASLALALRVGANPGATKIGQFDLAELLFYNASLATDPFQQVFNFLLETWGSRGDPLEQARDVASRRLMVERKPFLFVTYEAPLEFLDLELLDDLQLSNELGIRPNGVGWGDKDWQRGNLRLLEESLDLNELTLNHVCRDTRETSLPIYSIFEPLAGDQVRRRGSADARGISWRSCGGASPAWSEDPGSALYIQSSAFAERVMGISWITSPWYSDPITGGLLLEGKVTNAALRSSFVSALTGWVLTGSGAGGRLIQAVTDSPRLFDPVLGGTTNAIEFNHGTVAAQLSMASPAISVAANASYRFVHYWMSVTGGQAMTFRIKRAIDNFFWNDTSTVWQAGSIWNLGAFMELRNDSRVMYASKYFNVGGSATTLTIDVGFLTSAPSGGALPNLNRVFHVQLQDSPIYTSPIITNTAAVTRELQSSSLGTLDGSSFWPIPSWTLLTEVVPTWNAADAPAAVTKNIVNSSPVILAWKNSGSNRFECLGAIFVSSPVRGARYRIAVRACKNGDLDATSGADGVTSIFVNGTKGTDSTYTGSGATPGPVAFLGADNYIDSAGNSSGGRLSWDGYMLRLDVRPYAMTDEECIAWTQGG